MNKIIRRFSALSRIVLMVLGLFISNILTAQDHSGFDDTMRGSGKIYVVVAVCLTILIGLFLYVFMLDRKVSRLEKENK